MHIMEGFLPWYWCVFWYALVIPFIATWCDPDEKNNCRQS